MTNDSDDDETPGGPFSETERATLDAVLDLIVPPHAGRGLPGASAVGVPAHLAARAPDALPALRDELDALDCAARKRHGHGFAALAPAARQSLVDAIRAAEPAFMSRLAIETVTCYYLDDRVLAAIGMEARPPWPKGYTVMKGDLALLEPVRARGRIWRDAG
jgi:hypothetical protein